MTRLFGTDGVRGVANGDLTPELALRLGRAAGHILGGPGHSVIIGRDTRRSGRMLESALAAGLCSVGMDVRLTGHIPTPGLAYLARTEDVVAGAVISASHNPAPDNGIKFFDHAGLKLPDATEDRIEAAMADDTKLPRPTEGGIGLVGDVRGLVKKYEDFLGALAPKLDGLRVVLDCANGATYRVAPAALQKAVVEHKADVGFAFDGDGDRVMTVDATGTVLDGDFVLALAARHFAKHGKLDPKLVVGTVMTNGGLEATLARDGIGLVRTQVGDRYVWEELDKRKAQFGGEPSGHVIFREFTTTGDGILTGLEVLTLMRFERRTLTELAREIEHWPQITKNVKAPRRREWKEVTRFSSAVRDAETELGSAGRLVVRASGTEPVLRITVEARDDAMAKRIADSLAATATEALA